MRPPGKERMVETPEGVFIKIKSFEQIKLILLEYAEHAWEYGVSHRHFHVGVAALVRYKEIHTCEWAYKILYQANLKPFPGEEGPRRCGENYHFTECRKYGYELLMIVVYADKQIDDYAPEWLKSDPDHEYNQTLKCCGYCRTEGRDLIREFSDPKKPRVLTEHTVVISVNKSTKVSQHFTFGWLMRTYGVPEIYYSTRHP